jgi:RND family efflux transporter MFP subunit
MTSQGSRRGLPAWLSAILVILIVAGGIGVAVAFVKTRPDPPKEQEEASLPIVEVVDVSSGTRSVQLQLNGQVQPSRQIIVMPEVGGRIVWQNRDLVPGGLVKAGDPLVRLDPRDYSLAVKQQQTQLSNQQLSLKVESGRSKVAEREWELFKKERKAAGLPIPEDDDQALALRQPHMDSAKVGVSSARSGLSRAKLQLSKTIITAPFNAFVRSEVVEKGQLVAPGMQLATLVGTDTFWVQVSVPIDKLAYVRLPDGDAKGSKVKVFVETGAGRIERSGYVIRLLGDLDPVGRLARVLVEVKDPFLLKKSSDDGEATELGDTEGQERPSHLPLLLGSYVRVEIEGVELTNVMQIPRSALQENSKVYRLDADDKLSIDRVEVVWGTKDAVMVRGGLKKGDRLVVTNLVAPVAGMKVRIAEPAESPEKNGKEAKAGAVK